MARSDRLVFALDYATLAEAERGAALVGPHVGVLKIGLELFVREGPAATSLGRAHGCQVFLDLKLHDIPETVERAVAAAAALGVRYLTVHAAGGQRMLEAAARRAQRENTGLTLLAVSVLTSLDAEDLSALGIDEAPGPHAARLSQLSLRAGIPGLVCSPAELLLLRRELGSEPVLVTPGIRPAAFAASDDQKRTGTPANAVRDGASLLVVGRPIRDASDPARAAAAIVQEITEAEGAAAT